MTTHIQSPASLPPEIYTYHETAASRLVVDPDKARIEFGDIVASQLKLSPDGSVILWPQTSNDPEDPQNWSDRHKTIQLLIVTLASAVPSFDVGIGIAGLFSIARDFHTTSETVTHGSTSWAIFLLGFGGIFAVMLSRRIGRLPILFWSQFISLGFLIGCTLAPDFKSFTATRCLSAFFATWPHATGLYVVTDMYPFHLQAQKLNIWVMGFIVSPFVSPFALGFLVPRAGFRWAYVVGCIYSGVILCLIICFGRETIYDRRPQVEVIKPSPSHWLISHLKTLIGITGAANARSRVSWMEAVSRPFKLVWRPHLLAIMIFEGVLSGFVIGMNITTSLFLGEPRPLGYGFSQDVIAATYATPIVSVFIGLIIGRHINAAVARKYISRKGGIFEAEARLWTCYLAVPIYTVGVVLTGATFQKKLPVSAVILGWGIREVGVMINTVAAYAYLNNAFPKYPGEVSALLNVTRMIAGFAMPYFQLAWARKEGTLIVFGTEAAIVVALFILVVPLLQLYGRTLRYKFHTDISPVL